MLEHHLAQDKPSIIIVTHLLLSLYGCHQLCANEASLSCVCTENKQEGSPRGEGNQIEEAEDKGYNPLVPGRVVYIYRYKELKHPHKVETSDSNPQALLNVDLHCGTGIPKQSNISVS